MLTNLSQNVVLSSSLYILPANQLNLQTAKINQGNIALKRVVESIANGDSHVPFRDSKLTMLLQVNALLMLTIGFIRQMVAMANYICFF